MKARRFLILFEQGEQLTFGLDDPRRPVDPRPALAQKLDLDRLEDFKPHDYSYDLSQREFAEVFKALGVDVDVVRLGGEPHLCLTYNGERIIIEEDGTVHNAEQFIWDQYDSSLWHLVGDRMPEEDFWGGVGRGSVCYHATPVRTPSLSGVMA